MGMFDTLHAACPECGTLNSEQTKGGDCMLRDIYVRSNNSLQDAALFDGETFKCEECGTRYETVVEDRPTVVIKKCEE